MGGLISDQYARPDCKDAGGPSLSNDVAFCSEDNSISPRRKSGMEDVVGRGTAMAGRQYHAAMRGRAS